MSPSPGTAQVPWGKRKGLGLMGLSWGKRHLCQGWDQPGLHHHQSSRRSQGSPATGSGRATLEQGKEKSCSEQRRMLHTSGEMPPSLAAF